MCVCGAVQAGGASSSRLPKVGHAPGFERYKGAVTELFAHEAGYDAYMTGKAMLTACACLSSVLHLYLFRPLQKVLFLLQTMSRSFAQSRHPIWGKAACGCRLAAEGNVFDFLPVIVLPAWPYQNSLAEPL